MNAAQLAEAIEKHGLWLAGEDGGERANLSWANLSWADLSGADLRGADLSGANLSWADLRRADLRRAGLRRADLRGASLSGTVGNMFEIKSVFLETWPITYTAEHLQIGCERHPIAEWWAFDDTRIESMDDDALDWWRKWKDTLKTIIEMSPATPTGHEEKTEDAA